VLSGIQAPWQVQLQARARWAEGPREHRGKCGGRARQPRGQLTGCLWELPPAFACRGSHAPPRSGACRLTARHGGANSAQGTQGAPRKMQRQGAATPGSTHRVSVGCAPSLRLPRQPQTAPLRRLPPAPLPSALRLKNNNNNNVQRQNLCFTDASEELRTRSVRSFLDPCWRKKRKKT
jgi:hypothetical protein